MSDFEYGLDLRKFVCNYVEKLLSLKLTFFANTLLYCLEFSGIFANTPASTE